MKTIRFPWLVSLMISLVTLIFFLGCNKNDPDTSIPVITTTGVSDITSTTATSGGTITSDGGASITSSGVCWGTGSNPTIADDNTTDGTGAGTFTSHLTGLTPNTVYNVRAYATNDAGTAYGAEQSFSTKSGSIVIGTQEWMVENLKVTTYRNGDPIPNVSDPTQWSNLSTGAYSDYENLSSNGVKYGHLYNWYTITDSRNICPAGWHVPSLAEWTTLIDFLGGESVAGGKMKETGTTDWTIPNYGATNESGFSGLPGGHRHDDGTFGHLNIACDLWSTTESFTVNASFAELLNDAASATELTYRKTFGIAVRCIKD